jgi:UPF0755 protein
MDEDWIYEREKWLDLEKSKLLGFYRRNKELIVKLVMGFLLALFFFYLIFLRPPSDFPTHKIIHIKDGATLEEIASSLNSKKVIRSPSLFKALAFVSGNQKRLLAGDYFFNRKLNVLMVLNRFSKGEYGITPTKVIFQEGVTIAEIGKILKLEFEDFEEAEFLRLAEGKEGFLFPDTYKFLPNVGPRQVIFDMEQNFNKKINPLLAEIEESGHTLNEVIIMASLLEKEARTKESREMISGILWKRISIGMRLQVDAVFPYIIGKNTFQLTLKDLNFDSPYNTYKYEGLPFGPIANPGLSAIEATLRPVESNYLFYLSDKAGNMHYAEDFEGHKKNKARYLR